MFLTNKLLYLFQLIDIFDFREIIVYHKMNAQDLDPQVV